MRASLLLFLALVLGTTALLASLPRLALAKKRKRKPSNPHYSKPTDILAVLNRYRSTVGASNMQHVSWNYALETKLLNFTKRMADQTWMFDTNTVYKFYYPQFGSIASWPSGSYGWYGRNGWYLMEDPFFAEFKAQGFTYMMHDTCNDPNCVLRIFQYRLGQRPCFSFNTCDGHGFNQFKSCQTNPPPKKKVCNWVWQYYPYLMTSTLSQIACVELDIPGPGTTTGQKYSFFCYGKFQVGTTDKPWSVGPPCSSCPASSNGQCIGGKLCA